MEISSILESLNYPVKNCGYYLQIPALWRGGDDDSSVCIYPNDNHVIDWVTGTHYSIPKLISLITGLKTEEEAQQYLTKNNFFVGKNIHFNPKIVTKKLYDIKSVERLIKDHSYWINRKISKNVIANFRGGICINGKLKNRYIFPIIYFNNETNKEELLGFTGRALDTNNKVKWMHFGTKNFWIYPTFTNKDFSTLILVESIGDMLSLYTAGINNVLVLFGLELCKQLLIYILKIEPKKIIISLNNDDTTSKAGNKAALKLKKQLSYYFSEKNISILLPQKYNDWNNILIECGPEEIKKQFSV